MNAQVPASKYAQAAEQFDAHENRQDGDRVVRGLVDGLDLVRNLTYRRVNFDVESSFGVDSMLIPVSAIESEQRTMDVIDLFQIVEATLTVREQGYVQGDDKSWFVGWLSHLRLGDKADSKPCQSSLSAYFDQSSDDRRLKFGDILAEVDPASRRAPLVLFRLLPLAAQIATAVAFADHPTASELRRKQVFYLPAIDDCQDCRGNVLENGDQCRRCGNPVWDYEWLTASD